MTNVEISDSACKDHEFGFSRRFCESMRLFISRRDESRDDSAKLFPAERHLGESWAPIRQHQFANGRLCARQALAQIGVPPAALLRGPSGAPIWPTGTTGSISHTGSTAICLAGLTKDVVSVGADIEYVSSIPGDVWGLICTSNEIELIEKSNDPKSLAALFFCIKESLYKAQYSLFFEWMDFHDIEVSLMENTYCIQMSSHLSIQGLREKITFSAEVCGDLAQTCLVIQR